MEAKLDHYQICCTTGARFPGVLTFERLSVIVFIIMPGWIIFQRRVKDDSWIIAFYPAAERLTQLVTHQLLYVDRHLQHDFTWYSQVLVLFLPQEAFGHEATKKQSFLVGSLICRAAMVAGTQHHESILQHY